MIFHPPVGSSISTFDSLTHSSLNQSFELGLIQPAHALDTGLQKYVDWEPLGFGNYSAYKARNGLTSKFVELHLISWLQDRPRVIESLETQTQLIRSVGKRFSRPIVECVAGLSSKDPSQADSNREVPRIILEFSDTTSLDAFLLEASSLSKLQLAADLVTRIHCACSVGLYHGMLSDQTVRIIKNQHPECSIDYLERFYSSSDRFDSSPGDLYENDLRATVAILNTIILSVIEDENAYESISPRKLAIFKHFHGSASENLSIDDLFEKWLSLLREYAPVEKKQSIQSDSNDIDLNKATLETIPVFKNIDLSNGRADSQHQTDRTFEVNVSSIDKNLLQNDAEDEGTQELLCETNTAPAHRHEFLSLGDELGRFRLDGILGRGGMGIVYRGTDKTNGKQVAVKVLQFNGSDIAHAIRRFTKEARILASVQNEFVTELYDVGEDRGHHYLAMEFVDGTNLKDWMKSHTPVSERDSIKIVADIARALVNAHSLDIIHRDIKPENVLLSRKEHLTGEQAASENSIEQLSVKITDFGIARHVVQSTSMEVTRAGAMLGTPMYMAPEQCKGNAEVGPAADIYSLGITLYELLCGQPPFRSDDPMKLAAMQCFDPIPNLQKRNRQVSDRVANIVAKMLSKNPSDRYADAAQLLQELDRYLDGVPSDFDAHPRAPEFDRRKLWERKFEWELKSSPSQLWPYVTNTDRLNRASGLPPVAYTIEKDPIKGLRKFGSFRLGGIKIVWEEHPFEWIEGTRMGVLREFSSGPFKWFMSTVELQAKPNGRTQLIHTVKIEPRNTLGRIVSTVEAGWKGGRALDRVYKRIDTYLQSKRLNNSGKEPEVADAFEESAKLPNAKLRRLEQRMDMMIAKGIAVETAHKICDYLKTASTQALSKIRPANLGEALHLPVDEAIDACLVAASCGLLKLQWDILCPTCRVPATTESLLSNIGQHAECEACDIEFQSNVGNAIELVFCVHPEVREADTAKYCVGGPGHSPHVVSQIRIAPNERIELVIPAAVGDYVVRGTQLANQQVFRVSSKAAPSQLNLNLNTLGNSHHIPVLHAGQLSLIFTNDFETNQIVRVERTVDRTGVVTATTASTIARFRELFPEQTFCKDLPVAAEELSLFACELNNVDEVYGELGDNFAYECIHRCIGEIEEEVSRFRGAVVKTVGEGLLASFNDRTAAVEAAIGIRKLCSSKTDFSKFTMGIGIHRGRTLISTQNGRLDYFGTNARLVTNLAKKAGNSILLTNSIFSDSLTQEFIQSANLLTNISTVDLPGSTQLLIQQIF